MKLWNFEGEKVKIICDEGKSWEGKVTDYIHPEDNEPEGESIIVNIIKNNKNQPIEFRKEDIKSITII